MHRQGLYLLSVLNCIDVAVVALWVVRKYGDCSKSTTDEGCFVISNQRFEFDSKIYDDQYEASFTVVCVHSRIGHVSSKY